VGIAEGLEVAPCIVGELVVGYFDGELVGLEVGLLVVGRIDGWPLGIVLGCLEGWPDGCEEG
jgi:hypothetical protein